MTDGRATHDAPGVATRMTRGGLLVQLRELPPAQFEEVLFHAQLPPGYLSAASAPQATRAIEVIRYFESQNRLSELVRVVKQVVAEQPRARATMAAVAAGGASAPPGERRARLRFRRFVFVSLLAIALVFALLYGLGIVHQNAVSDYMVLVVIAGVTAMLTFDIMSSTGQLSGTPYRVHVKLTGAVVPLIVVLAGGLAMRYLDSEFAVKLKFVDGDGHPVKLTGTVRLEIAGAGAPLAALGGADLVAFDHLRQDWRGRSCAVSIDASGFEITDPRATYSLQPDALFTVGIRTVEVTTLSGTVSYLGQRMPGGRVTVAGRDCEASLNNGYFSIPCRSASLPVRIEIQLPADYAVKICETTRELTQFTGNDVTLAPCRRPPPPSRVAPAPMPSVDASVELPAPRRFDAIQARARERTRRGCTLAFRVADLPEEVTLFARCDCRDGSHTGEASIAKVVDDQIDDSGLRTKSFEEVLWGCPE